MEREDLTFNQTKELSLKFMKVEAYTCVQLKYLLAIERSFANRDFRVLVFELKGMRHFSCSNERFT